MSSFMDSTLSRVEMKLIRGGLIVCNITIYNKSIGESYSYQAACSSSDVCDCDQYAMRKAKEEAMQRHESQGSYTANCYYF